MQNTGPYTVALGSPATINPPSSVTTFAWVVLANTSPFACTVDTGDGPGAWLQSLQAAAYPVSGQALTVTPSFVVGSSSETSGQITATWYLASDQLDTAAYPVALPPQTVTITGGTVEATLSGAVTVETGTASLAISDAETQLVGSPFTFAGTVQTYTFALPAGCPPLTGLHIIIAGPAVSSPNDYPILTVTGATSNATYLNKVPAKTGSEFQVDFSSTADPGGVTINLYSALSIRNLDGTVVYVIGKTQSTVSRPVFGGGVSGPTSLCYGYATNATVNLTFTTTYYVRIWSATLQVFGSPGPGNIGSYIGDLLWLYNPSAGGAASETVTYEGGLPVDLHIQPMTIVSGASGQSAACTIAYSVDL